MFVKRHLISTREFSKEEIDYILSRAEELEVYARGNGKEGKGRKSDLLKGKILANLFYEPSTRTRFSFETARSEERGVGKEGRARRDVES